MIESLRILSYNVHKGFSAGNRRFLLDEIRDGIREVDAELVFLQEVVGENQHHAKIIDSWVDESQFEYLADTVWPHYAYGRNAVYQHGHHGNAILSKWHILHSRNVDVSHYASSQRGLLLTVIEPGIYLVCLHLGLLGWERRRQFRQLETLLRQSVPQDAPLIIAGDFNDWRQGLHRHFTALGLREAFSDVYGKPARSFPARAPLLRLDRIYHRGFDTRSARVLNDAPWRSLSDHCGLYCELQLNQPIAKSR